MAASQSQRLNSTRGECDRKGAVEVQSPSLAGSFPSTLVNKGTDLTETVL